jgi:hypothetical protein
VVSPGGFFMPSWDHGPVGEGDRPCSAKGCRQAALWALRWNNPRLHEPDRRKTWAACEEHRAYLSEFLQARGFLREVERMP